MNPCNVIECPRWTSIGDTCFEHATPTANPTVAPKSSKSSRGYDALPEQVAGIGVVTTRRIMVTRIKSVRRNGPVSYYTGFSEDMMRDSDTGRIRSPKNLSTPIIVHDNAPPKLIATMKPSNMMNPDA